MFILHSRGRDGGAFIWGRIVLTRLGADRVSSFPIDHLTTSRLNLLLVRNCPAKIIIIVKRLNQGRNKATKVRVDPTSCDEARRKIDTVTLLATLPTLNR